jgi:hypothetical protein
MKNKLRSVHINSVEWKYASGNGEVRIYEPDTKQIKARVSRSELIDLHSENSEIEDTYYGCYTPETIKKYIKNNLL